MATTKKASELVQSDLGKHVTIDRPDGDHETGELKLIRFAQWQHGEVNVSVDSTSFTVPADQAIQFDD